MTQTDSSRVAEWAALVDATVPTADGDEATSGDAAAAE